MHDHRKTGEELLDFLDDFKVKAELLTGFGFELKRTVLVPMATASESQPVRLTNSLASSGFVSLTLPTMSSSTPPSWPSSASTLMPLA